MHIPVLLETAVRLWASLDKSNAVKPGIYIDGTFGSGGHGSYLIELGNKEKNVIVIGLDRDGEQIKKAKSKYQRFIQKEKLFLFHDNFSNIKEIASTFQKKQKLVLSPATECGINSVEGLPVRGVLFDFGLCTDQLTAMRGFSFNEPGALLDMRFDREYNDLTAAEILNTWPEEQLATVFRDYGDEKHSRKAAGAIVESRKNGNGFKTVEDLLVVLNKVLASAYRRQKIHYATRIFQALRIAVNREAENILEGLKGALSVLNIGGRIVTISFHSGEDRIVKNFFRQESRDCICPPQLPQCVCGHQKSLKILTKKPITPSWEEINQNPNASSAKLRAAEKI
ncbi:MAG: 16S rRNA (cytosine(1402)-N(4))-methyltransferase RsmH [Candidatus Moraniibacteriota bacterium]